MKLHLKEEKQKVKDYLNSIQICVLYVHVYVGVCGCGHTWKPELHGDCCTWSFTASFLEEGSLTELEAHQLG